jgi:hypothetical protein
MHNFGNRVKRLSVSFWAIESISFNTCVLASRWRPVLARPEVGELVRGSSLDTLRTLPGFACGSPGCATSDVRRFGCHAKNLFLEGSTPPADLRRSGTAPAFS